MGCHSHSVGRVGSVWDATHIVWVGWEVCGIPLTQCGQGEKKRRNGEWSYELKVDSFRHVARTEKR